MEKDFWTRLFVRLFGQEESKKEENEKFYCESCNKRISEEEYDEHGGLCRYCRGAPTQQGFPSPPGFPKA